MHSPEWSNAPPPRDGHPQRPRNTHDAGDAIENSLQNFSLRDEEIYRTNVGRPRQSLSPSQSSLGESRTSPYPLHGDGDLFPPESPAMSLSQPASHFNGYSGYSKNRYNNRGSLSSSTASSPAPPSHRESMQSSFIYEELGRKLSIHSDTSSRSPPRPWGNSSPYGIIDSRIDESPRPSSPASQTPPQPSSRPTTPQPPPPEDKYDQPPELPLSPKSLPVSAGLNHPQPVRPPARSLGHPLHPPLHPPAHTASPVHPPALDYRVPPLATPTGQHNGSSQSLPTERSISGNTRGPGYIPSPVPSPQPPRSVPPMQQYYPPDFLTPGSHGTGGTRGTSLRSASPRPAAKHYVAIGIDFGTTYSGVSWAYSGNPNSIRDVQQYPSTASNNKSRDEAQVPTLLDPKTGNWGYLIQGDEDPIRWFKLLLLNDHDVRDDIRNSEYLRATREKTKRLGDDGPIQLVADFLRQLWRVALREIALEVKQDILDSLPLKVALTVPAIWPGYAKESMKRAARRAGILDMRDAGETELILVQEPEAAALATLMERRAYPDMVDGETFMVVDCGGGTVDIISYKVMSIEPFRVREVVAGAGKLCGAFMIDDKFVDYMMHKTGFKFDSCGKDEWRQFVYSQWEYALKRTFTSGSSQPAEVHLTPPYQAIPALMRMAPSRMAAKKVVLSRDVINGFFEETYQGVLGLVKDQYSKILYAERGRAPRNIVLVGGLGSSRYLSTRLQEQELFPNIVQPQRAWSAVARGAVIALLRNYYTPEDITRHPDSDQLRLQHDFSTLPEVASRIARLSYGVMTGIPIYEADPPVDHAIDRIHGGRAGQEQRVWRMKWFVNKGDKLDNREPVSYTFYEYVNDPKTKSATFKIFVSDADAPPVRFDASCSLLCTLSCQYDTPFDSLRVVNRKTGLRIVDNMRLTMRFGAEPEWRLQVGRRDVKEKVNVEFQLR